MPFPNSPSNGQLATVNNLVYVYNSTKGVWNKANVAAPLTTSSISITGNITTSANLNVTSNGNIGGNLVVNGYSNVFIATGTVTNRSALTIAGNVNGRGGVGYLDALTLTNTFSGATNPNKWIRLNSTGGIEVVNNAYSTTILSLTDAGGLSVPGPISISGKQAVNGPAFSAYATNTLQTITTDVLTKVLFQTEEFDTANCYANSTFTPNVEGYYQLNAEVRIDGSTGTGEMMIMIYKNGTGYKRGTNQSGTQIAANFWAMQVSSVVYANGTSDYFEIYVQHGAGVSRTVTAVNNSAITWFNGCMVRGA
jgi:hypothetical protein